MTSVNSVNSVSNASKSGLLQLLGVLVAEVALVAALHLSASPTYAVPFSSIGEWLQTADPAVALVALARLAGLAIGYWLLATTVLYAGAHRLGWSSVTGALRWVTLPAVRRMVHGMAALSITSATFVGPAAVTAAPAFAEPVVATADMTDMVSADVGMDETVGSADDMMAGSTATGAAPDESGPAAPTTGYQPEAAGWPNPVESLDFWKPTLDDVQGLSTTETVESADTSGTAATSYTVAARDSLWGIAEDHLRQATGRDVTEDEVTQYWAQVIEANQATLRSGDPNLIYPDEQITLPPVFTG